MPIPRTLLHFFKRPTMHIPRLDYNSAVSFLLGFDSAREGEILAGFREWLIVKLGYGNNLAWSELVLRLAYPEPGARPCELPATDQERLVGLLFATIEEFWKLREEAGGHQELIRRHAAWLRTQDWYQEARIS
jgi:hypothetical protein